VGIAVLLVVPPFPIALLRVRMTRVWGIAVLLVVPPFPIALLRVQDGAPALAAPPRNCRSFHFAALRVRMTGVRVTRDVRVGGPFGSTGWLGTFPP
jgi:hypothetical protein